MTTANEYVDTPMTYAYRAIIARRVVYKCANEFNRIAIFNINAQAAIIKRARDACLTASTAAESADKLAASVTLGREWHDAARDADSIASKCIDKVEAMERMYAARKAA